jgi:hypothetical protein
MYTMKSALQSDPVSLHIMRRIEERMVMLFEMRRRGAENRPPHPLLRISHQDCLVEGISRGDLTGNAKNCEHEQEPYRV